MTMFEAIKEFETAAHQGAGSAAYRAAVVGLARIEVETLEDISSIIAIAVEVVRAGHVDIGLTMIERGQHALDERLRRVQPPARSAR